MLNIDHISEEVADLDTQEVLNIKVTAEKYKVKHKTFENQWKSKSVSIKKTVFTYRQCLINS